MSWRENVTRGAPDYLVWDINICAGNDYHFSHATGGALNQIKGKNKLPCPDLITAKKACPISQSKSGWMTYSEKHDSSYLVASISGHCGGVPVKKRKIWEVGGEQLRTPCIQWARISPKPGLRLSAKE